MLSTKKTKDKGSDLDLKMGKAVKVVLTASLCLMASLELWLFHQMTMELLYRLWATLEQMKPRRKKFITLILPLPLNRSAPR